MTERHYVGVYWEDRPATKEQAAGALLAALGRMRAVDPLLAQWHLQLDTREASVEAALTEGRAQALLDETLAPTVQEDPKHGWLIRLWNGQDQARSAKLELTVGAHLGLGLFPSPNSCIVHLPRGLEDPDVDALLRRDRMAELLGELARAWEADWGVVSTDKYLRSRLPHRGPHYPRVGWLTFLHRRRGQPPRIPNTLVTPVEGLGVIASTDQQRFSYTDGEAVADMEVALEKAGVLEPTGKPSLAAAVPEKAAPIPGAPMPGAYGAALDAAVALDALAARVPGRRTDLADALVRAGTTLVIAAATQGDLGRLRSEVRALVDLAERLLPGVAGDEIGRAREAIARVVP